MQDRVSLYPGRVKLEPVAGQANLYDLTRADQPTQEGTPLSKATFLKDATAALFGLDATAVPDDVLNAIKNLISANTTLANSKAKIQTGSYKGTGKSVESNKNVLTFSFQPKLVIVQPVSADVSKVSGASLIAVQGGGMYMPNTGYVQSRLVYQWSGNSLYWYSTDSVSQFDVSNYQYVWIALG